MLHGELSDFTLDEILAFLEATGKSGQLHVHGLVRGGRIAVRGGGVLDATADAGRLQFARRLVGRGLMDAAMLREILGELDTLPTDLELLTALRAASRIPNEVLTRVLHEQTVDAVFDLLGWPEGTFRFEAGELPDDIAALETHAVAELLEAARERRQRWPRIEAETGAPDTPVTITEPSGDADLDLGPDAWQLIGLIDGARTIADLVALTGRGDYDVRRGLLALHEAGIVGFGAGDDRIALDRLVRAQTVLRELEERVGGHVEPAQEVPAPGSGAAVNGATVDGAASQAPAASTHPATPTDTPGGSEDTGAASANADAEPVDDASAAPRAPEPTPAETGAQGASSRPKLRTDPSVDVELVDRLISGIRTLS
ncbi:MAG: DUF4388 domain-containing protein [Nitriliruptoraceae bacterium]|nr:DUF4388 domain-containing protein [Nitriliruptoraceae bacterium]